MRNILLTISYDGTDFCGWQRQDFADKGKAVRTVQQTVEDALEKLHKQKISLQGSGRTDSGVHAFAQAANFYSPVDSIPIEKYPVAWNVRSPCAHLMKFSYVKRFSSSITNAGFRDLPMASTIFKALLMSYHPGLVYS